MTTSDGYNLDNGGGEFQIYLSSWLNEAVILIAKQI